VVLDGGEKMLNGQLFKQYVIISVFILFYFTLVFGLNVLFARKLVSVE
jgi:hypothetical protein